MRTDQLFKCGRGVGLLVYAPDRAAGGPGSTPSGESGRNARYAYLVGRLRNRQMTMEEATELFNLMQGMLQTSEAARVALMRATPPPPSLAAAHPPSGVVPRGSVGGTADDLFLVGLLAMGAGAGLLAAMSKRVQDTSPPSTTSSSPPAKPRSSSPPG